MCDGRSYRSHLEKYNLPRNGQFIWMPEDSKSAHCTYLHVCWEKLHMLHLLYSDITFECIVSKIYDFSEMT